MRAPTRALAPALVLALTLGGCLDAIDDRLRADFVEPPRWEAGDWWTYRVTSDVYGTDVEVNVTVAEVNGSVYLMGYPEGTSPVEALLFHMPAFGPVRDDLSWEVHGEAFRPADWPLSEGKEWDTKWIAADVHLVARLDEGRWDISNLGFESASGGIVYNLTYDPEVRWFTSFTRTDSAGALRQGIELVAYGRGARDAVLAPELIEVAFLDSRTRAAFPGAGGLPAPPTPSFTRPEGNETLLVGCIIGGASGRYQAEIASPSGTVACSRTDDVPTQDPNYRMHVAEVANEAGTWTTRLLAAGEGTATAEVLAYPLKAFSSPGAPR